MSWPALLLALAVAIATFALSPFRAPGAGAASPAVAHPAPAAAHRAPAKHAKPAHRPAPRPAARVEFGGYPCGAAGCRDYRAGFVWAAAREIEDPDACTGKTWQFIEGCRVYAYQRAAAG
jgi:hypothetical protein